MTKPHEVSAGNFKQNVLQSDIPVLVDFWAAWCGPCRLLAPILENVAKRYAGRVRVAKLNVDENQSISLHYVIRSIPTLVLFRDGVEQERVVGVLSEEAISLLIEKHIGAPDR